MTKRTVLVLAAFLVFAAAATAQKDSRFYVALQGGGAFSINENCAGFFEMKEGGKLVKPQGALTLGYFFTNRFGIRLQGELSGNTSANNYQENHYKENPSNWKPYSFQSFLGFADFVINGGNVSVPKAFNWRLFAGVGVAHSYNFSPNSFIYRYYEGGPIYKTINYDNYTTFAFRFGFNLEYIFRCGVGILFESCHEWMTDNYNGQSPRTADGSHEGFPFDTKLNFSVGVAYHF